jgi:uncharacterized membrane protein YjjP (DUF1212 family)
MGLTPENLDNKLSFALGVAGGVVQYMLNIHLQVDFWSKLLEAVITAGLAGFAGMIGKELFVLAKRHFGAYFNKRKNNKQ